MNFEKNVRDYTNAVLEDAEMLRGEHYENLLEKDSSEEIYGARLLEDAKYVLKNAVENLVEMSDGCEERFETEKKALVTKMIKIDPMEKYGPNMVEGTEKVCDKEFSQRDLDLIRNA